MQIIGTRKCPETRKAERYFRERGASVHFVDLRERPLSPGELANISRGLDPEQLLDRESPEFQRRGLAYKVFDPLQEILAHPLLLRTPVVRFGREVTLGPQPAVWESWLRGAER